MKVLFVHQNFPGQFRHLAPALAARGHEVRALTDAANRQTTDLPTVRYEMSRINVDAAATRLGRTYTTMSDRGVVAARRAMALRDSEGYWPDVIVGHSGWGETLFLKEVWPEARLIVYAEFYYRGQGADVGFDPEFAGAGFDPLMIAQGRATHLGQAILHADAAISPTEWQASTHPALLRPAIRVLHDGIDTDRMRPDPAASITLPSGRVLNAGDEVLTYVSRNLEPYRGFHVFMRALPDVLDARPEAQVVIVGGDEVSYGATPKGGGTWREMLWREVGHRLDPARVHVLGRIPHDQFRALMQVTRVHAYLTYPFVLSWSLMEAMAAGAVIAASDTAPVAEVVRDGENGRLVPFFDRPGWVTTLGDMLARPEAYRHLGEAARATIVAQYDLTRVALPRLISVVEGA